MKQALSFFDLFCDVFIYPRKTIRAIIDQDTNYWVWPIILTISLLSTLDPTAETYLVGKMPLGAALLLGTLVSFAIMFGAFWLVIWFIYFMGKILGGKGTFDEVKAAYTWGAVPAIIGFLFDGVGKSSIWINLLSGETDRMALLGSPVLLWQKIDLFIYSFMFIWSMVLDVIAVSEAHQISKLRSCVIGILEIIFLFLVLAILSTVFAVIYVSALRH